MLKEEDIAMIKYCIGVACDESLVDEKYAEKLIEDFDLMIDDYKKAKFSLLNLQEEKENGIELSDEISVVGD